MHFDPPTRKMKILFGIAISLMFLHKVECWFSEEWLDSPFFLAIVNSAYWAGLEPAAIEGELMFLVFCVWLFIGLAMGWLVMWGGSGPGIALAIWGFTFILEWHHVFRTIGRGEYYPGIATAVVYLPFGLLYWRELLQHAHLSSEPPPT